MLARVYVPTLKHLSVTPLVKTGFLAVFFGDRFINLDIYSTDGYGQINGWRYAQPDRRIKKTEEWTARQRETVSSRVGNTQLIVFKYSSILFLLPTDLRSEVRIMNSHE